RLRQLGCRSPLFCAQNRLDAARRRLGSQPYWLTEKFVGSWHRAARTRRCSNSVSFLAVYRLPRRLDDELKERAAQLPEPPGLNEAASQDTLAVANDLF